MGTVREPAKELEVTREYDTVVCGGGIAGISAALASARCGAKTLLIEREFMLGGLATAGLVAIYLPLCDGMGRQVTFGIAEELARYSVRFGTDSERTWPAAWLDKNGDPEERKQYRFEVTYNPQVFAADVETLLADAGVDILFGTVVCSTMVEDGKITHLIIENKSGRAAIAAKAVVDATGDADIVHQSGEDEAVHAAGNVLAAWYYSVTEGHYQMHMLGFSDAADAPQKQLMKRRFGGIDGDELSEQTILSHANTLADFRKHGELSQTYSLATMATIPQVRMTRRLNSACVMDTADDHKEFSDSVGLFGNWHKKGAGQVYELRFGALHGDKIKNLICAGRNLSNTDALWDLTRVIPVCALSGQAAGTAAAMFPDFTTADVAALQKKLQADGVVLHEKDL